MLVTLMTALIRYAREWETSLCIAMSVTCVVYVLWRPRWISTLSRVGLPTMTARSKNVAVQLFLQGEKRTPHPDSSGAGQTGTGLGGSATTHRLRDNTPHDRDVNCSLRKRAAREPPLSSSYGARHSRSVLTTQTSRRAIWSRMWTSHSRASTRVQRPRGIVLLAAAFMCMRPRTGPARDRRPQRWRR